MSHRGDQLASGGASATFQGPTREMPGTDVFREPGLQPVAEEVFEAPEPKFMPAVGPIPIFEEPKPQVGYRGRPFWDQILIQRVEREHSSNIILPDSMKLKSDIGFVIAVGNKVEKIKEGQLVLFDRFASHGADIDLIDYDGIERKYLLLREYDVQLELEKIQVP